jgi:succinyl-diaminopimelate desuccinylase
MLAGNTLKTGGYTDFVKRIYAEMIPLGGIGPSNGGEGELDKCVFLEGLLRQTGFREIKRVDAKDQRAKGGIRPNLVAKLFGNKKRTLWVIGHMDVVPPGDVSLWSTPPFEATFIEDKVFGRGTEDDGQGIVLPLVVAKTLLDQKVETSMDLGAVFVSDEETGSKYGAQHLLSQGVFGKDDWVLVPDAGNHDGSLVEVAEKGSLWFKVEVIGKQAHASTPEKGVNANRMSMKLGLALDDFLHSKYSAKDELFEPPESTFEPTKREANVRNVNTVPGSDVFYFDCRVLPRYDLDSIIRDVRGLLEDFSQKNHVKCNLEVVSQTDASIPTDPNSELVRKLVSSIERLRNIRTRPTGIGGGTVAKYFRTAGIPTVVWMTCDDTAHQPDEYAKPQNILDDAEVILEILDAQALK